MPWQGKKYSCNATSECIDDDEFEWEDVEPHEKLRSVDLEKKVHCIKKSVSGVILSRVHAVFVGL